MSRINRLILRPVIDTLTWLLPAMLLIGLLKSPWVKGLTGLVTEVRPWPLIGQVVLRVA